MHLIETILSIWLLCFVSIEIIHYYTRGWIPNGFIKGLWVFKLIVEDVYEARQLL